MSKGKILVVDDEIYIVHILDFSLGMEGYEVVTALDGEQALERVASEKPDLIVLDIMMPKLDGYEVCRAVKSNPATKNVPVILLSAKGRNVDQKMGFDVGADDYITKPFNVREVLARIRAVLRRYESPARAPAPIGPNEHEKFTFSDWVFDTTARELKNAGGQKTELTTAEFNLLELFVRRPARVLSRDAIMDIMKGQEWAPMDRSIDTLVARLRKKIESDPEHPSLIKTVRGVGYVLVADVTRA